jgi:hypothetical protein
MPNAAVKRAFLFARCIRHEFSTAQIISPELTHLVVETVAELGNPARDLVKVDGFALPATLDDVHRGGCCRAEDTT